MSIVISIVKSPENSANTKSTHTFAQQGGTIGRSSDNEWVLEDPERFISSQHSKISFENGQYYLTDLSTNGTFQNGAAEPIGKGNTIKLNDGDKFALGDYEFLTSVWQPEEQNINVSQGPFADTSAAIAPEPVQAVNNVAEDDYFGSANSASIDDFASPLAGHVSGADSLFSTDAVETDPLAALDSAQSFSPAPEFDSFNNPPPFGASQSDQADPMQQAVSWPNSTIESGGIPENWEDDLLAAVPPPAPLNKANFLDNDNFDVPPVPAPAVDKAAVDKKSALEKANEKILAEIAILKKQAQKQALQEQIAKNTSQQQSVDAAAQTHAPQKANRASTNNEQTLIEVLGLAKHNLNDEKIIEINQVVGELVRETITGMMQVLSSRSTIKNEFRMNVTTIQPVENNPLKFSANVDDAIENMFVKDGNAYKKPVEAIKEGFEGIAEHQVAILAGIRTAFKGVLHRFDPAALEQRFEQFNKPGILPGMSKAKNWDSYKQYYKELVDDMDNSFQHLFGYEFVQAYEEQLQKIAIARKTNQ